MVAHPTGEAVISIPAQRLGPLDTASSELGDSASPGAGSWDLFGAVVKLVARELQLPRDESGGWDRRITGFRFVCETPFFTFIEPFSPHSTIVTKPFLSRAQSRLLLRVDAARHSRAWEISGRTPLSEPRGESKQQPHSRPRRSRQGKRNMRINNFLPPPRLNYYFMDSCPPRSQTTGHASHTSAAAHPTPSPAAPTTRRDTRPSGTPVALAPHYTPAGRSTYKEKPPTGPAMLAWYQLRGGGHAGGGRTTRRMPRGGQRGGCRGRGRL